MAVDTREKRFSMMSFHNISVPRIITPDGTLDQGDRQHLLWGYSGNAWIADLRGWWRKRGRRFTTNHRRRY